MVYVALCFTCGAKQPATFDSACQACFNICSMATLPICKNKDTEGCFTVRVNNGIGCQAVDYSRVAKLGDLFTPPQTCRLQTPATAASA